MLIDYATFRRYRREPVPVQDMFRSAMAGAARHCRLTLLGCFVEEDPDGSLLITIVQEQGMREIVASAEWVERLCAARAYRTAARWLAKLIDATPYTRRYPPRDDGKPRRKRRARKSESADLFADIEELR